MPTERDGNFGVDQGPDPARRSRVTPVSRPRRAEFRPSFGHMFYRWDDPLTWSVGLVRWCGYRVGVHWFTVFWLALQLMLSIPVDSIGTQHVALVLGWMVVIVGLREGTRLWLARRVGNEPEYIVLWPLGSLIGPTAPRPMAPKLLLILAPTIVSLLIGGILAAIMLATGSPRGMFLFNPFAVRDVALMLNTTPLQAVLGWAYFANLVVGVLNLLPMLPLDGGRLFEAWAWRNSRDRARRRVGQVSLVVAGVVTITGIAATQPHLIAIAVFGGFAGWLELRRSEFVDAPRAAKADLPMIPPDWIIGSEPSRASSRPSVHAEFRPQFDPEAHDDFRDKLAAAQSDLDPDLDAEPGHAGQARELAEDPQAVVDRVLAKISASGLASLTDDERATLARETRRLNGE